MNDNRIPLTYTAQRSTERLNAELARQRSRNADRCVVNMWIETYNPPTPTKAAMLENAVPLAPADDLPRFANIRDGVKADRQDYTILAIAAASLVAAALIAWIT